MLRPQILIVLAVLFGLSACAKPVWAPDDVVAKASYSHKAPTSITLVTVINNTTGEGGHSGIVINASERVVFDPAGNFKSAPVPERNDVLFGMSPHVLRAYYGFHARTAWHVVTQEVEVTPEIAQLAYQRVLAFGAVGSALCANSVTSVLKDLPGFETMRVGFSPKRAMRQFATLPNVVTDRIYEYD